MQLKRIDISGFKSFATKTTIEFNEGVTAVVGPNGSGKSNIIEAIRWVMGEQSAKSLRGGRMNDIIFAGSDSRKPVNIAEVTLVLDNQDHFLPLDFSEVSITRRLHRSGDSEFYLNKQACRLKDIVDLFMDSGLGKESFSIISQGKVESIFNSKPEDRRAIFEEAAGVLKYKTKKKKAEQKLIETKDNLNRVQDIVYELESQIEPLKIQSSIAKDYLQQKEQLRDVEIGLAAVEIKQFKLEWQEQHQKNEKLDNQLIEMKKSTEAMEVDLADFRKKKQHLSQKVELYQEQLVHSIQSIEQFEGKKNVLTERTKHTQENKEKALQSKEQLAHQLQESMSQLDSVTANIKVKESEQKQLLQELKEVKKERELLSGNQKQTEDNLRDEYIDMMQQETSLKNEQTYLAKNSSQHELRNVRSQSSKNSLQKEVQQLTGLANTQTEQLKLVQQEIAEKLLQFQEKQAQLQSLKKDREVKENQLYDAMRVLQQAKAKRDSLKELSDDYTGFYQGVKEVLTQKDRIGGIVGAVTELIEVPKRLELAIDIALGAAGQHIVVQDETSGRRAIQFLKQKHSGRATFLPLTSIKSRFLSESVQTQAKSITGYIGVGSEIIQYPDQVKTIVQNLLGTTLIAENLEAANLLAKHFHYKYRVVSLEGDVMNAGGSMTGGSNKKGNRGNLLSRKNDLQSLKGQIQKMDELMQRKEIDIRSIKQAERKEEQLLNEFREIGERKRLEEQELKSKSNHLEEEIHRLTRELKAQEYEESAAKQEADETAQRLNTIQIELASVQEKMAILSRQMEMVSSQNEEKELRKTQLTENYQQLIANSATLQEHLSGLAKEQERLSKHTIQLEQQIMALENQLKETNQFDGNHQLTKKEIEETLSQLKAEKIEIEDSLKQHKQEKQVVEEKMDALDQQISIKHNQRQSILEKKAAIEVAMNRLDVAVESRLNILSEGYGLTFEAAAKDYTITVSLEEAKRKVKLLKQGIEELGTVNLAAIDEYERVNERYTFLSEQKADLEDAKNSLFETMDEMDAEVTKRFSEMFEAIRGQFSAVFQQLFGGGTAELKLTDPSNLLTTGIDIIAQPPGKKLQQLSLLSGGERSLTAIALLFSILLVRPVPFCILDEVEAALDEANVVRFGRYLRKFEKDTQFIVITHRKGTMQEANGLYGVTMQESGVSKIVSVRLEEMGTLPSSK
ncbi:chromosome segregation protein SMC [Desemzia sp. RIT804]|uniref:chromosome segregation protein SMC n=1 Tax=Desemzia sp. RIT 804 TaxID=2810209 RepID=UPI00194E2594|nr:chromosome segregation protein SMC [Desemzia sp. RIT 804]